MQTEISDDPPDRAHNLRRQALNLIAQAIHDRRLTRADLRLLVALLSSLMGNEDLSTFQDLCTCSGLSDEEARASMQRLRRGGYLTPRPDEDFSLNCSTPGEPPVMMSTLQTMARRGELRIRAFGETKCFALGVPNFGSLDDAIKMLPRLVRNGLFHVYRDESGFFLGPANPALIDSDPFADDFGGGDA